jgi:hypothetical protein
MWPPLWSEAPYSWGLPGLGRGGSIDDVNARSKGGPNGSET